MSIVTMAIGKECKYIGPSQFLDQEDAMFDSSLAYSFINETCFSSILNPQLATYIYSAHLDHFYVHL
jgi:hypothetical protein